MFKFLHAADIHLDSPLHRLDYYEGAPVAGLRRATRKALENLVELAVAEQVAFVLIAGDLFDGDWKDYNTGLFFVSQMSKLREAHIPVFIIAGNHDAESKITRTLRLPEGVNLFPADKPVTLTLDNGGVAIHGQSFSSPAVRKNLAAGYPPPLSGYFNIGLLHTCATGREGHLPYAPCSIEDLRSKGYEYWALGHVHQREVLLEDPLTVFPGNIQGRHIRETGPKGCVLVTVDDQRRAGADFRPLDVIRWFRVDLDATGVGSGYDVVDAIKGRLDPLMEENRPLPLIARVEVTGGCEAHDELASDPERWINEIRSMALDLSSGQVWVEKVKIRTRRPLDRDQGDLSAGPVSELLQCLEEVRTDPNQLEAVGESLGDIVKRLPRELMDGPDGVPLRDRGWLSDILGQIQPMLLHRLMRKKDRL